MERIEQRVRERAYYIWEDEGRLHGRADAHWLRAEAEIAGPAAILTVQAPGLADSAAQSPAKTLKPKTPRAKAAAEVKPAAKSGAKPVDKPAAKAAAPKAPKAPVGLVAKAKAARPATAAALH